MAAILLNEEDSEELIQQLEAAEERQTTAVSVRETIMAIGRETGDRAAGLPVVREFLRESEISVSEIGADLIDHLAYAYLRFGKSSGHPARLNLGGCFSYAMAKREGTPLLYKGNDFAETDLV